MYIFNNESFNKNIRKQIFNLIMKILMFAIFKILIFKDLDTIFI